jgi:hypothetical protein
LPPAIEHKGTKTRKAELLVHQLEVVMQTGPAHKIPMISIHQESDGIKWKQLETKSPESFQSFPFPN